MKKHPSKTADAYEDRVIAFIDILGFRELVAKGKVLTILKAMEIIRKRVKLIENVAHSPLKTSQFSDTLILSAPSDSNGLVHIVHFVSLLASELFLNGIWCRGAIASGALYDDGNVVFGPALINAYEMESQLAVYPRILVTETVAEKFVDTKNAGLPKWRRAGSGAYFRRDFDHLLHLDIFSYKMFIPPKTGTIKDAVKGIHDHLIDGIDVTETPSNMKVQAKLFWISTYLSYVEEVHGAWHFTIAKTKAALSPPRDKGASNK
jgi:hypothetical protein